VRSAECGVRERRQRPGGPTEKNAELQPFNIQLRTKGVSAGRGKLGANKRVTSVGEAVHDGIEIEFESSGDVDAFDAKRKGSLPKKLFVIGQGIEAIVDAGSDEFRQHFGARLQFEQGPDRLTDGNELSAGLKDAFGLAEDLDDVGGLVQHGGANHEIEVIVRKIQVVEVGGHAGDFSRFGIDRLEYFRGLLAQEFWGKIRGGDFDNVGQFGELSAQPGAARADLEDAAAKVQAAFFDEEGHKVGEVTLDGTEPLGFLGWGD